MKHPEKYFETVARMVTKVLGNDLKALWVVGSHARGTAVRSSDLDLVVEAHHEIPLHLLASIDEALDGSNLPLQVEVVDAARMGADARQKILRHAIPLFGQSQLINPGSGKETKEG